MREAGRLIIKSDGKISHMESLSIGVFTVGKANENNFVVNSPLVARKQLQFEVTADAVTITHVGSTQTQTLLDGQPLPPQQPTRLNNFAKISIANNLIEIQYIQPEDDESVEDSGTGPTKQEPETGSHKTNLAPPNPNPPRPTHPPLEARDATGRYMHYLPGVIHSDFLERYLKIMETTLEPIEWRENHRELLFNPHTAPAEMLEWLAGWLDADVPNGWPEARRRLFISQAFELYRDRGTTLGMQKLLWVCAETQAEIQEAGPYEFKVLLNENDYAKQALIESLIQMHKPAHTGHQLEWKPTPIAKQTGEPA